MDAAEAPESPAGGEIAASELDQRLQAMFEIARILATEHDLQTLMSKLITCLLNALRAADAGLLMLYDAQEDCLTVRAAQGYDLEALRHLRIVPGESMTGKTFLTGQAGVYPTPEATEAAMATMTPANLAIFRSAITDAIGPRSAIAIPLITNNTKVGVLILENLRQPGSFGTSDLAFLKPVGDLLALAIENLRLRDEVEAVRSFSEANRLKAEVISTLAHEMRTPLTSIKGYSTALLLEEATFSPELQREFLEIIDEECDVLQDLIRDLLESSMIDAGFLKLEPQPVLLSRLAREVVDEITHLSQKHRFVVDFPAQFPILEADPMRIRQVLRNLLDNAVKYSPAGGLVVVRGEASPADVRVSVADQGEGIAPEHLNRLFEKFFRIKSALGRHVVGTGLGLPIARTIIEGHGGRIWAESQLGHGTTFYFTLPLRTMEAVSDASNGEATDEP